MTEETEETRWVDGMVQPFAAAWAGLCLWCDLGDPTAVGDQEEATHRLRAHLALEHEIIYPNIAQWLDLIEVSPEPSGSGSEKRDEK